MHQESKVVIVGGGFAGLMAAKHLKKAAYDIVVIDRTNHHLFQPLLYQVATSALSPSDIARPIRDILKKQPNANVIMANVDKVDLKAKQVQLENGYTIDYSHLILAPGARHSYFGHPEWEVLAKGLKSLDDALKIREHILFSFEKAERCDSEEEAKKYLTFVIVGAGPTGVEMSGAIAEIAHKTMLKNFSKIDPTKTQIFLINPHSPVLPSFPPSLGNRAEKDLKKLGVQVISNKRVTNITPDGVYMDQEFISARNVIWAAGNQASPLLKTLEGAELDPQGRVVVDPDLSVPNHPEVFVIGDAAHVKDKKGNPLPAISPAAIQQGRFVAKIIQKNIPKEKRSAFKYFDKGMLATIGKYKAIGKMGVFKFKGLLAWFVWGFVHVFYLAGFANKLLLLINWSFYFIAGQRNARIIPHSIKQEKEIDKPGSVD